VPDSPKSVPVAIVDANVLFPLSLRDLFLRAVEKGLYRLRISRQIWDEVIRNLIATGRMAPDRAAYLDARVQEFLSENDAFVSGYEALIPTLANDAKDRHVLAAAVHAKAETIITFNLRDFLPDALAPHKVVAEHPDVFLCRLYEDNAHALAAIVREQAAGLHNPPMTVGDVLNTLAHHVPTFVSRVRSKLELAE
jgi:predicted nucleic acid-binding protein